MKSESRCGVVVVSDQPCWEWASTEYISCSIWRPTSALASHPGRMMEWMPWANPGVQTPSVH